MSIFSFGRSWSKGIFSPGAIKVEPPAIDPMATGGGATTQYVDDQNAGQDLYEATVNQNQADAITALQKRIVTYSSVMTSSGLLTKDVSADFSSIDNVLITCTEAGIKWIPGRLVKGDPAAMTYAVYNEAGASLVDGIRFAITVIGTGV